MSLPDPCPDTGRRIVTVAEWYNRPDELFDEYAYWFSAHMVGWGLDPWRLVKGIEARDQEGLYDVHIVLCGIYWAIPGIREIYVRPDHFALLNLGRP